MKMIPSPDTSLEEEQSLKDVATRLLCLVGEDPRRLGLKDTPKRFAKSIKFLTSGAKIKIDDLVGDAVFDEPSSDLVFIQDIDFFSMCEHHILPFFGKAHIAYIPNGKVIGLSKIPRIVDAFARRLQVQERLTFDIAKAIERVLNPQGVIVITEASHLCMMMRGVQKQNTSTITKTVLGKFSTTPHLKNEIMSLIKK